MVRCALWSETRLGLQTLDIGRSAIDRQNSCSLELSGTHLFYSILLDGGLSLFRVNRWTPVPTWKD